MAGWLTALLNLLPSIIEAIINGLKGHAPSALAPEADMAAHNAKIAKCEDMLAASKSLLI